jgi:hypothetical protein
MNKAEIMTLISARVNNKIIRRAIVAGKISSLFSAADRDIYKAEIFRENADWTELLRVMEGTLDKEIDHQADSPGDYGKRKSKL